MIEHSKLDARYWRLTFNAAIASYMDAALIVSVGISLSSWQTHFNLDAWWTGALSTFLTISIGIGSFFGGRLSDIFGRIRVFNLDILFVAIGSILIALAPNTKTLILGLVIAGLASGADLPTSLAVISERIPPDHQGRVISSTQIFWTAGIIISQGIGFLVSGIGELGITILFLVVTVIALLTWLVRVFSRSFKTMEIDLAKEAKTKNDVQRNATSHAYPLSQLLTKTKYLLPLISLTLFYLFWNLPANTYGSFLNYYLVKAGGRSQAFSTVIAFTANIVSALVLYFIYMKFADGPRRYTMMHIGMILTIAALAISALGSSSWLIFTICYFVYACGNVLHGEPLYKIWSQELFPVNARATATGFSYAVVRTITAIFALATPAIMEASKSALLWTLVICMCLAYITAIALLHFIRSHGLDSPSAQ